MSVEGTSYRTLASCLALSAVAGCDDLPTGPAEVPAETIRAVTLADWTPGGYGTTAAADELQALASTGASSLWIIATGYQVDATATTVVTDAGRTPTADSVRRAAEVAAGAGLDVAIKPHVDLDDGAWRGTIDPVDVAAWFDSYHDFLLPWADLAADIGAVQFVVGTELAGTVKHEGLWRETIRLVRARFTGQLTYAASWDEASRIGFWDALELVGVNAYFPVANRADPSRFEILAGWQPWLDRLEILHRQTSRDILITEIGYRSVDGAGMHPYRFDNTGTLDLQEQADLYWAALQATGEQPWMTGLVWWNWLARGGGGALDRDYTPSGKPAQQELQGAWRGR
ncbi:MAG: hypothetical protein ACE5G2_05935 [Candidatus Krumholzibacteriia bacterium]